MNPFKIGSEAQISARGLRRLKEGHLWIYATDILEEPSGIEDPIVRVVDPARNPLGFAFHSRESQIRLRMLSREQEMPTEEFFRRRLACALLRRQCMPIASSAYRIVYSEADLLPSIIVDRYGDYLVLQTLSRGSDALKDTLVDFLRDLIHPAGILERNDVKSRKLEGLEETKKILFGVIPKAVEIEENGLRFLVDLWEGQKTGFFLDQRENRSVAAAYARGRGLDCFTNTGGFALHFARRCEQVTGIDASAGSIRQAGQNAALNNLTNVAFQEGNVFDRLRELERAGETFEIICLDPPAFAKNHAAVSGAISGYKEINLRCLKLLRPEGILVTSSCSYHLTEATFYEILHDAAQDARRTLQILERRGQANDHPILSGMPETHYLKCFIARVI